MAGCSTWGSCWLSPRTRCPRRKSRTRYMHIFLDAGGGNVLAFFELPTGRRWGVIQTRRYGYSNASGDALLGELWLATVLAYQEGFVVAVEAGDGLAAALHTPAWTRLHLGDACLRLLYRRHDFVQGDWLAPLRRGVRDQAQRFEACLKSFARHAFGRAGPRQIRYAAFALAEVPIAAVKPHLQRREPPPPLVDELIIKTYRAIVVDTAAR